ncbi:MAG: hypothetical protein HY318_09720, partial [Armatimonadetes bacterium]|nr:hypothetical protein [Armatimonadota bacterium]
MNRLCRSAFLVLSLAGLLSGVGVPAWAKVKLDVIPLFGTTVPPMGCLPLAVRLQNEGPSAQATLIVDASSGYGAARRHLFPVSLPAGSQKEILTFPFLQNGSSAVTIQLIGVRPALETVFPVTSQDNARVVVGIGDEIGGLEFIRTLNATPPTTPGKSGWVPPSYGTPEWFWSYCRPEHIPDRAAAFTGVSVLVLGSGAERLTSSQWQAIRTWVMMGGILFAPGGSGAVYLRHVALADLLPVQNLHTMTWSDWKGLRFSPQTQLPAEATYITAGDEVADAKVLATASSQSPLVLAAFRPYGAGGVVFTAFNLWDKPFRGWQGMPELWRRDVSRFIQHLVSSDWSQNLSSLSTYSQQSQAATYYATTTGPPGGPPTTPPSASRPIPIKLPGAGSLTFTLLVYFAMVVPFSYLCLKRYRKLDWHWLTGPMLA